MPAPHVGIVHEVVVKQRVIMVYLQSHGHFQRLVDVLAVHIIYKQQHNGTDSLSAQRHYVAYGFVKVFRLVGIAYFRQRTVHYFYQIFGSVHYIKSLKYSAYINNRQTRSAQLQENSMGIVTLTILTLPLTRPGTHLGIFITVSMASRSSKGCTFFVTEGSITLPSFDT